MAERTVLLTAAAGNIGSELVPQLISSGNFNLILPTSNPERLRSSLPSNADLSKVVIEEGSIQDARFVFNLLIHHNVDTVFLCVTGADELFTTCNFIDSLVKAAPRVKHLVYISACGDFVSAEGTRHIVTECGAAHVLVKTPIEQKFRIANLPWKTTVLGPTLFFNNDVRAKDAMFQRGVFDEPVGEMGVSRVSTADIALAAKNAMLDPDRWGGKKIMIGSLKRYSGAETCEIWGEAIGKKVTILKADDEYEDGVMAKAGGGKTSALWARDLRLMYEYFERNSFGMSDEEYKLQIELLGKEPDDFATWVKKTAETWK